MSRGGWNSKGKREANGLVKLTASKLNKYGFFTEGTHSGSLTWTNSYTGCENGVRITSTVTDQEWRVQLRYTSSEESTPEKIHVYGIWLDATSCRYGGRRFWFICHSCGRRVGTLYLVGDRFGCRHCHNLTYASRNEGGHNKGFVSAPQIDEQRARVGRCFYRGKPTRKYRRYLKMEARFTRSLVAFAQRLRR